MNDPSSKSIYILFLSFFAKVIASHHAQNQIWNCFDLVVTVIIIIVIKAAPAHARRILRCLRSKLISARQDPNWSHLIRFERVNCLLRRLNFNFLKILKFSGSSHPGVMLTTHSIHTSLISRLGVYHNKWWLSCVRASRLNQRRRTVQSLTKLSNRYLTENDCYKY